VPGILTERRLFLCRSALFPGLAGLLCLSACAGPPRNDRQAARRNLAILGIELLDEEAALLPEAERGRSVPCRSAPGFRPPPLPPHPAGYLITGIEGGPERDSAAILRALASLEPGETLRVIVRRNPYLGAGTDWWEARVELRMPLWGRAPAGPARQVNR
jgi:hypothetical protein